MRTVVTTALLALFGLALSACGSKANIHGVVTDVDGTPIADAAATIAGSTAVGMSSATGEFSVAWMPGSHEVMVGKLGYLSYARQNVRPLPRAPFSRITRSIGVKVALSYSHSPLSGGVGCSWIVPRS